MAGTLEVKNVDKPDATDLVRAYCLCAARVLHGTACAAARTAGLDEAHVAVDL